jgi:hypothetical protein
MTSTPSIEGKYQLKSIHAEIDLLDRRLAHLEKYDNTFATDSAKAAAARKLMLKRKPLEESARRMAAEGVEFSESELPRSFRPEGAPAPVKVAHDEPVVDAAAKPVAGRPGSSQPTESPEWEKAVAQYMRDKKS